MSTRPSEPRLSEAEREHLESLLAVRRRAGSRVSARECAAFRRRVRGGESCAAVARDPDVNRSERTVRQHVRGDCRHDGVDESPVDVAARQPSEVSASECAGFRRRVRDGETRVEVAAEIGRGAGTVAKHVAGDCSHDDGIDEPPVDTGDREDD